MSKAKYIYSSDKRMWSKHSSTCCGAELTQKMLYLGKIVTDPKFTLVTTGTQKVKVTEPTGKKWWQFWKPKFVAATKSQRFTKYKEVQFRYYCDDCGKQNNGEWQFRYGSNPPKEKGKE